MGARPIAYHRSIATTPQPAALVRRPSPEQFELAYRRRELAALRRTLAERESQLAALRTQLHSFEGRYIRQVGVLYIQLDDWHDRIAELNHPNTTAAGAPGLASETWDATSDTTYDLARTTYNLRSLFRDVAKRIHPDFARDPDDARHRTHLMAQANDALRRKDAQLLHRMLHSHDLRLVAPTPAAELGHTLTLIQHLQQDLLALEAEYHTLAQSEMAQLQARTIAAALRGQDLLAEMAARVKGQIGLAMRQFELDQDRIRRKLPRTNPEPLLSAELQPYAGVKANKR